ncbi:hypothetical protein [Saccharopolyspora spinosa]|uniref:hypothetical protein n=1 Tax=Saccharopolyspora spinosa TaxID=60894 RepID=UPI003BA98717
MTLSASTYGLIAPDGTPPEITKRLEDAAVRGRLTVPRRASPMPAALRAARSADARGSHPAVECCRLPISSIVM